MTKFELLLKNTRDYCDYLETHYNNVQKAFKEFTRRLTHKKFCEKYNDFLFDTGIVDDYWFEVLRQLVINHDLSKLSKFEFTQYRDNFYPLNEGHKKENLKDLDEAWEHHKKVNLHHWENRFNNDLKDNLHSQYAITYYKPLYAIENAMDWIAMAYYYNETPLNKYYLEHKQEIKLSEEDRKIIETIYEIMMDKNLE